MHHRHLKFSEDVDGADLLIVAGDASPYLSKMLESRKANRWYLYKLEAVNAAGDKTEIEFGASRELHQNAFLKLDLQPIRGVVRWSEISEDSLPPKVAEALD